MEFKRSNIFAELGAKAQAARGNGVTTLRPVPAVDRLMVDVALGRIAEIEKTLEAGRAAARVAARRAGVLLENLFGETRFVPRSTAQRWRDQGIAQGATERTQLLIRVAEAIRNPDPRFAGVGEALRRGMERGAFDGILGETTSMAAADDPDAEAKDKAAAIIQAGERARSDGSGERPLPGGLAGKILKAGERRRKPMGD